MRDQVTIARNGRLEMYSQSAADPAFWDAHWKASPPRTIPENEHLTRWFRSHADAHLPKDGLIVEAGCGNGNLLRLFRKRGFQMEGIDFAREAIEANRKIDPGGSYRIADVRSLPYANGSLAGYLSFGVVEHFDQTTRDQILGECVRCLRPGGVALITTPYYSPLRKMRAALGGYDGDPGDLPFYQYMFTAEDLCRQIEAAGLKVLTHDGYDIYKGVKDTVGARRILTWLRGLGRTPARWIDHPPRTVRRALSHMLLVAAAKPGTDAVVRVVAA